MTDSAPMIEVRRLTKAYGGHVAVRDVSFEVPRGEVVGFLGPNGAGKSTTLRILAGFLGATSGSVRIAGVDVATDPEEARQRIGYMPESCPLHPEMRVREYLTFRAELKGVPRARRKAEVVRVAADAKVDDHLEILIGNLSKGYRQRVGLADALLGSPPLLVLDEPTAGLDPNQIKDVRDLVRRLGESHTVFVSTHILPEVEQTCSRAVVIAKGRLVAQGTIDELRAMGKRSAVRVVARGERPKAKAALQKVRGASKVTEAPETPLGEGLVSFSVEPAEGVEAGELCERIASALHGAGLGVRELGARPTSLEQVFAELTLGADAAAQEAT
jgi:ABC-2 type transport system ATP-binding protein